MGDKSTVRKTSASDNSWSVVRFDDGHFSDCLKESAMRYWRTLMFDG